MQSACNVRIGEQAGFQRLECDARAEAMLDRILDLINRPGNGNPFWSHFEKKVIAMRAGQGPKTDALFLLHSNVYYLRDLLEDCEDQQGLQMLDELEHYCF